jgi:hypothetical protein
MKVQMKVKMKARKKKMLKMLSLHLIHLRSCFHLPLSCSSLFGVLMPGGEVSRVLLFAQAIVHRCFPLGLCLRLVGFTNKYLVLVFGVDFKCGELCESPICLGKCV